MDIKRHGVMAARLEASLNSLYLQAKLICVETQSLLLIVIILLLADLSALGQRPPNDQFTNSIVLVGNSVTFSGTLNGATNEAGEPYPYIPVPELWRSTVWWSWTATEAAPVTIELLDLSTNLLKLGG